MRVRNNRPTATNPGIGGSWAPGEVRDLSTEEATEVAKLAGFSVVPDLPVKSSKKGPRTAGKGGKKKRTTKKQESDE